MRLETTTGGAFVRPLFSLTLKGHTALFDGTVSFETFVHSWCVGVFSIVLLSSRQYI